MNLDDLFEECQAIVRELLASWDAAFVRWCNGHEAADRFVCSIHGYDPAEPCVVSIYLHDDRVGFVFGPVPAYDPETP